jgi:hypothetical protein
MEFRVKHEVQQDRGELLPMKAAQTETGPAEILAEDLLRDNQRRILRAALRASIVLSQDADEALHRFQHIYSLIALAAEATAAKASGYETWAAFEQAVPRVRLPGLD